VLEARHPAVAAAIADAAARPAEADVATKSALLASNASMLAALKNTRGAAVAADVDDAAAADAREVGGALKAQLKALWARKAQLEEEVDVYREGAMLGEVCIVVQL
jgi:hypothetical protein